MGCWCCPFRSDVLSHPASSASSQGTRLRPFNKISHNLSRFSSTLVLSWLLCDSSVIPHVVFAAAQSLEFLLFLRELKLHAYLEAAFLLPPAKSWFFSQLRFPKAPCKKGSKTSLSGFVFALARNVIWRWGLGILEKILKDEHRANAEGGHMCMVLVWSCSSWQALSSVPALALPAPGQLCPAPGLPRVGAAGNGHLHQQLSLDGSTHPLVITTSALSPLGPPLADEMETMKEISADMHLIQYL